jgi:SAM-dependent methyltransferase
MAGTVNRSSLRHQLRYAIAHPDRIPRYARRLGRDTGLRLRHPGHVAYYRAVMRADAAASPDAAVGSATHDRWLALGQMQFDYLVRHGLAPAKVPHLVLVDDLRLAFLPGEHFDVVHAHSVVSHSPMSVIDECLAHVGRVLKPDGWFDFTFDRTEGEEHHVLREDFYYRTQTLVALAHRHGLDARFMDDWERLPHKQSKLRVTRRR